MLYTMHTNSIDRHRFILVFATWLRKRIGENESVFFFFFFCSAEAQQENGSPIKWRKRRETVRVECSLGSGLGKINDSLSCREMEWATQE